jgi:hypothetical protein
MMGSGLSSEQLASLAEGDKVYVQFYGDRHETTCIIVRLEGDKLALKDRQGIIHRAARTQVTAILGRSPSEAAGV